MSKNINRREFLKKTGEGAALAGAVAMAGACAPKKTAEAVAGAVVSGDGTDPLETGKMELRTNPGNGDKVSLLGYGCMRFTMKKDSNGKDIVDQDNVNNLIDYALAHGVNYFDTAPAYGRSEEATGIALKRHPRNQYYIATKMSNQRSFGFDECKRMYERSFERLQIDYIDYYLMHSIGGSGMDEFNRRFIDNGLLDFLVEEKKAGRIRNLGFSYHGNVEVFDWLLDHDDKYHWDFVQIELNYVDWRHASLGNGGWKKDADAEYLYNKLEKTGIQAVVMEPLLGGRLANVPEEFANELKAQRPNDSVASWAFRWVGTLPNILTALSGMNNMDHLIDNVNTFSPLDPCTEQEKALLAKIADGMSGYPIIPCTACRYCMPCPYDVDIPGNFAYYNEAVNTKLLPLPDKTAADYASRRKTFVTGYKKAIDEKAWASQCMDCEECLKKCPQQIRIPNQMARIVELIRE